MRALTTQQRRNDILLAAVVFVGALISASLTSISGLYGDQEAGMPLAVGYAVLVSAPLAVRRRWPATVAVVVCVVYFLAVTLHVPEIYAGNIAVFIALYTVGAWSVDRRRATVVRVSLTAGMFVWLLIAMFRDATAPDPGDGLSRAGAFSPYVAYMLLNLLINILYFGGAYWFGERAWLATEQRRILEERSAELERERERTSAQAVALDRVRIARELHDVVAHHVSLMGVQAGAARAVMDKDPDAARATLAQVEGSARTALAELRQLLETLRADGTPADGARGERAGGGRAGGDGADADTAPTTLGLDAVPALVDAAAAAGLPTTLTIVGEPHDVPETAQVNLYRIAQEALTNARRHAGPGATADVRLRYGGGSVELEVANTGRLLLSVEPGLGLRGMRERAAASGGTIELAPRPRGGFLVRVSVPTRLAATRA